MTTVTTQSPKQIVDQIIVELGNCPDNLDSATHFQFVTERYVNQQLTSSLCSSDSYDYILTIHGEHWMIVDGNNGYSAQFVGSGELLYGWTEEMIGDTLSEDQRNEFQDVLQFLLSGVTVVNRELTIAEKGWQEEYVNNLDNTFQSAVNQVFK